LNLPMVQGLITKHEGFRCLVYRDTKGNRTIAIGFNLDAPGADAVCATFGLNYQALLNGTATVTWTEAEAIRDYKISSAEFAAHCQFPKFDELPDQAQAVVLDMLYEMGSAKFAGFRLMIAALNQDPPDFNQAASQMKQSAWYGEVPTRAQEDCQLMCSAATPVPQEGQ
jgi:GH24 family phage-related lysozyme (muramidase)